MASNDGTDFYHRNPQMVDTPIFNYVGNQTRSNIRNAQNVFNNHNVPVGNYQYQYADPHHNNQVWYSNPLPELRQLSLDGQTNVNQCYSPCHGYMQPGDKKQQHSNYGNWQKNVQVNPAPQPLKSLNDNTSNRSCDDDKEKKRPEANEDVIRLMKLHHVFAILMEKIAPYIKLSMVFLVHKITESLR